MTAQTTAAITSTKIAAIAIVNIAANLLAISFAA